MPDSDSGPAPLAPSRTGKSDGRTHSVRNGNERSPFGTDRVPNGTGRVLNRNGLSLFRTEYVQDEEEPSPFEDKEK